MKITRYRLFVLALVAGLAIFPELAPAQTYPSKTIRIIVPFAPSGSGDLLGRIIAQKLTAALGQSAIVENREGAGGNIGTVIVAKAPSDGYTLLAVSNSFVTNPYIYNNVGYDPVKDFEPVTGMASYMYYLVVSPSFPARSVKELIAAAKAQANKLNYSSSGIGTGLHLSGELFQQMTGVKMTHVPYKGGVPAATAVMSGEVQVLFGSTPVVPFVNSGKLVLLAVSGKERAPSFPNVPTIAEAGVPGYDSTGWSAVFAPAGTNKAIVKRLSDEISKGLREPDALEQLKKQDLQLTVSTPEALGTLVREEVKRWGDLIKVANIKVQ